MGISEVPEGTERTVNLQQKQIPSTSFKLLVLQVQELEGVSYAAIRGMQLVVLTRTPAKVFPKVDEIIGQFSRPPVGITKERQTQTTPAPTSHRDRSNAYVNTTNRRRRK